MEFNASVKTTRPFKGGKVTSLSVAHSELSGSPIVDEILATLPDAQVVLDEVDRDADSEVERAPTVRYVWLRGHPKAEAYRYLLGLRAEHKILDAYPTKTN